VLAREFEDFQALTERVRTSPTADLDGLRLMLDHAEAYPPDSSLPVSEVESIRRGIYAMSSLVNIARVWTRNGVVAETRARALASAVRLSTDEDATTRMACAATLVAARDAAGGAALTSVENRTLDALLADREVKWQLDRLHAAWREEAR